ncbi:MAG: hypothetical protein WCA35_23995, partial [Kovacikia sp.]
NRPVHAQRSLESLAQNKGAAESELYIFCDAPKRTKDIEAIDQVRSVVGSQPWCGTVHIIEQEVNQGCAASIIQGVTKLCQKYGRVIVIEDDLVLSPFFLDYMNRALDAYADLSPVMQISGHMFPANLKVSTDSVFLPFITSWGWATWQRAWQHFDADMSGYKVLRNDRRLRRQFDLNNSYAYFSMLEDQRNGRIDSWAIRWYLSVFIQQGLTLYPVRSLVNNVGFDGSGTHCGNQDSKVINFSDSLQQPIISFPIDLKLNSEIFRILIDYFHSLKKHETLSKKIAKNFLKIIRK